MSVLLLWLGLTVSLPEQATKDHTSCGNFHLFCRRRLSFHQLVSIIFSSSSGLDILITRISLLLFADEDTTDEDSYGGEFVYGMKCLVNCTLLFLFFLQRSTTGNC